MKIRFVEVNKTLNKIFLEENFLGTVEMDVWTQKWSMDPSFRFYNDKTGKASDKYESSYKAGKALVALYEEKKNFFRDPFEDIEPSEVRDIFDSWSP
jgi:hypothetical protein